MWGEDLVWLPDSWKAGLCGKGGLFPHGCWIEGSPSGSIPSITRMGPLAQPNITRSSKRSKPTLSREPPERGDLRPETSATVWSPPRVTSGRCWRLNLFPCEVDPLRQTYVSDTDKREINGRPREFSPSELSTGEARVFLRTTSETKPFDVDLSTLVAEAGPPGTILVCPLPWTGLLERYVLPIRNMAFSIKIKGNHH